MSRRAQTRHLSASHRWRLKHGRLTKADRARDNPRQLRIAMRKAFGAGSPMFLIDAFFPLWSDRA